MEKKRKKNVERMERATPLIGILTVSHRGRILGNLPLFKAFTKTADRQGGKVFVFTPGGIDWIGRRIRGLNYLPEKNEWQEMSSPWPDVVYNRIPNRKWEALPPIAETINRLSARFGPKFFNPSFFDKGKLYELLSRSPWKEHLPPTYHFKSEKTLREALSLETPLYIKPTDGKAGEGIFYVEPVRGNKEETRYLLRSTDGEDRSAEAVGYSEMWRHLAPLIIGRSYLIQKAIPRLTFAGRPFDLRVLVQKGEKGKWGVTGIGVRLAGLDRITTHVPQGGSILSLEEALSLYFTRNERKREYRNIEEVSLRLAQSIDEGYGFVLGEMSMDLGLSPDKKIWFFEANAKPMKFDEPSIQARSLKRRWDYCAYLVGLE
ncbi:MAG: YheC/YheD family protein [Thermicanus sp.]|nr:YheC/YheD family protein [Thermicanus sp.]